MGIQGIHLNLNQPGSIFGAGKIGNRFSIAPLIPEKEESSKTSANEDRLKISTVARSANYAVSSGPGIREGGTVQIGDVTIANLRYNADRTKVTGTLDLSNYGLSSRQVELQFDPKTGEAVSAELVEPASLSVGGSDYQVAVSVDETGVSFDFSILNSNENDYAQETAAGLEASFNESASTGIEAIRIFNELSEYDPATLEGFLQSLQHVASNHSSTRSSQPDKTEENAESAASNSIHNFFAAFHVSGQGSDTLFSQIRSLDGKQVEQYLSAAVQSRAESNTFQHLVFNYQNGAYANSLGVFLNSANKAGADLEGLLNQFNRLDNKNLDTALGILEQLDEGYGEYRAQLERSDDNEVATLLQAGKNAGSDAELLFAQLNRLSDKQYGTLLPIAAKAGGYTPALASQLSRVGNEQLDQFIDLSEHAQGIGQLPALLDQMARYGDSDVSRFIELGIETGSGLERFIAASSRVMDEDLSTFLNVAEKYGDKVNDLTEIMNNVRSDATVGLFLRMMDSLDANDFKSAASVFNTVMKSDALKTGLDRFIAKLSETEEDKGKLIERLKNSSFAQLAKFVG